MYSEMQEKIHLNLSIRYKMNMHKAQEKHTTAALSNTFKANVDINRHCSKQFKSAEVRILGTQ